jgi:FixJ family two-component response regulator
MHASENPSLVVVVDDDTGLCEALQSLLGSDGLCAACFASAEAFLDSGLAPSCVVLDSRLPQMGGLELLQRLRAAGNDVPAIFITAHDGGDGDLHGRAMRRAGTACFRKPFDNRALLATVRRALSARRLRTKSSRG